MIQTLTIERFKSIRELSLECRKVNVFIGAPDTGKTNVLEALCFLSSLGWIRPVAAAARLRQEIGFEPLFFRQFIDQPIRISMRLSPPQKEQQLLARIAIREQTRLRVEIKSSAYEWTAELGFGDAPHLSHLEWLRFYSYVSPDQWGYNSGSPRGTDVVAVPYGANLTYIARHRPRVFEYLKDLISALGWKLKFDHTHRAFRLSEVREDEILDYNLELLSDSLKRLFFYSAILFTSENATLVLDEPDVFAFPPYPKTLGEMIAIDESNQFFLTTHNPYFLAGLVEKTPADQLALFVCSRDPEGATEAALLSTNDVSRVIEYGPSVFFNLDRFLPES